MIDLHMHTKYSDGTDDCIELLKKAQDKELEVISITDHNTAMAYKVLEDIDVKNYYKGKIIKGIELSTKVLNVPIEILGYGIDYTKMNELTKNVYMPEEKRNLVEVRRLLDKCLKAGIKIDEKCLKRYDCSMFASKFIHSEITKYEENKTIIEADTWNNTKNFYRKYMSNPEGPLYVEMDDLVPDLEKASNLIKEAGGLVFLPHIFEYKENSIKILENILENYKIDGIECFYTTFTNEQSKYLQDICKKQKLYMSGGSDYHGKNKPEVELGEGEGNLQISYEVISCWVDKIM